MLSILSAVLGIWIVCFIVSEFGKFVVLQLARGAGLIVKAFRKALA